MFRRLTQKSRSKLLGRLVLAVSCFLVLSQTASAFDFVPYYVRSLRSGQTRAEVCARNGFDRCLSDARRLYRNLLSLEREFWAQEVPGWQEALDAITPGDRIGPGARIRLILYRHHRSRMHQGISEARQMYSRGEQDEAIERLQVLLRRSEVQARGYFLLFLRQVDQTVGQNLAFALVAAIPIGIVAVAAAVEAPVAAAAVVVSGGAHALLLGAGGSTDADETESARPVEDNIPTEEDEDDSEDSDDEGSTDGNDGQADDGGSAADDSSSSDDPDGESDQEALEEAQVEMEELNREAYEVEIEIGGSGAGPARSAPIDSPTERRR